MKSVAVFCGSSSGNSKVFTHRARELGSILALRNMALIYGGASVGLMGAVADGALSAGGQVTGVLPLALRDREIAHTGLTRLLWTNGMHERKNTMYSLADGVIVLPGGYGTLDETFEFLTWAQLGIHKKPTGFLNIEQYFDPLCEMLDSMVEKEFLKQSNRKMAIVSDSAGELLDAMGAWIPPAEGKWIGAER